MKATIDNLKYFKIRFIINDDRQVKGTVFVHATDEAHAKKMAARSIKRACGKKPNRMLVEEHEIKPQAFVCISEVYNAENYDN